MGQKEKLKYVKKFKKAVEQIVVTGYMPGCHGICFALDEIDPCCNSYGIMATLLTHSEYCNGLGTHDGFNIDRQGFILLLYTMSEQDILKCWEHYEKMDQP